VLALWTEKPPDAHGMPACSGEDIKWNFGKFLITNGNSIKRCVSCTVDRLLQWGERLPSVR